MAKRQLYKPAPSVFADSPQNSSRSLAQGTLADKGSPWAEDQSRSPAHEKVLKIPSVEVKTPDTSKHQKIQIDDSPFLRKSFTTKNEVEVLDASGPILNPELREVSTSLHKVFSPAKVICHSPSPERPRQPRPLTMEEDIRVKIDSPKIILTTENASKNETAEANSQNSETKSSLASQRSQENVVKKKKKAPRVIQSRYKNPKEQKQVKLSKPADAPKTFVGSFHEISAIDANMTAQGHPKGRAKAKVTSTPFNQAEWREKTLNVADGSYLDTSAVRNPLTMQQSNPSGTLVSGKVKVSSAPSGSQHVSETQLDMEYCRMLQAMYLNGKVKESFAKQEKQAKYQIYKVWQENQRLKTEGRKLATAICTKKQTMTLDQLLKAQDHGLRAVEESLDQFHNSYLTTGEALDTTRHYLPLEDIIIQDEGKLIAAMKESQMLLAEISSYTGSSRAGITKLAADLSAMVETLNHQISEQERCNELLLGAKTLTNHERSLQAQIILSENN
eukprot:gene5266-5932_t